MLMFVYCDVASDIARKKQGGFSFMSMSDLIGGHTHAMDATAQKFVSQAEDFKTALANITSAVQALLGEWYGTSPQAYQNAMGQWDKDARQVVADLEAITKGLKGSSTALTDLDNQLAQLFNGLGG
jgi:WXG100 family type VII secretion target